MALLLALFTAGLLTIFLPCILPLLPVVLGVSIAGRSKWRPLLTVLGMVVSFVGFTFLLLVALNQFVELADYTRIGTFEVLFLFGAGFLTQNRIARDIAGVLSGLFFLSKGDIAVIVAMGAGVLLMEVGGIVASRIQQIGTDVQAKARGEFGSDSPLTAFIIGLTLGLIWVPCAGPALGFVLTLVREQPGSMAALYLLAYALGTAVPLILIGYGGQAVVHSVRSLNKYTGVVKRISGILLILTAIALHTNVFMYAQVWIEDHTSFGSFVGTFEERFFTPASSSSSSTNTMNSSALPKIIRAPEFTGLSTWHNSDPFTLESLKGKVVLVDFWTYSCINCIRTLPYIQGYWEKYKETDKFVLLGVHTPEFTFEKSPKNVALAIKNHGLTYPVAQDNDFGTWSAFANRYWPAKYLIDANGYVRYTHFGEGAYEETDEAIQSLLDEIGVTAKNQEAGIKNQETTVPRRDLTPEIYIGSRSWPAFGNALGDPTPDTVTYKASTSMTLHKYYLAGEWQLSKDAEYQTLRSEEGEIRLKFAGGEANLVLGLEDSAKSVTVEVIVDGKPVKTITVTMHDLYTLFDGAYGEHELTLKFHGKGVQAFAFTFGQGN